MKKVRKVIFAPFFLLFSVLFMASACSDPEFEKASQALNQAESETSRLASLLKTKAVGSLPNLRYLQQYGEVVRRVEPDMAPLVSTLEAEGTVDGGMFTILTTRLASAKEKFATEASASRNAAIAVGVEAIAISQAAKPDVFNDSLVDVINVLADMSKGKLPKLNFSETNDKTMPPTQHLVGNPAYGNWRSQSGGGSFWVWYGQYRLFSDVLGWGRYRYNQNYWYRSRSASYYGDVGRHYYGTDRNNRSWAQARRRQPNVAANKAQPSRIKRFRSANRLSTYAPRTNAAPRSMTRQNRTNRTSSYANTRSAPSRSGGFGGRRGGK
ncbi:MAG: hypothetical protein JKY20_03305 [Alphaproteobacteria bacterium]|nr:hypothetical protein [Alphaproteobacteria bacterium]